MREYEKTFRRKYGNNEIAYCKIFIIIYVTCCDRFGGRSPWLGEPRILLFLFYASCVHFAVSFYVFMMLSLFELIMDEEWLRKAIIVFHSAH